MRLIGLAVVLALNLLLDSLSAFGQQPAMVHRLGSLGISQPSADLLRAQLDVSTRLASPRLGYVIYRGPLAAAPIAPEALNG